MPSKNQLTPKLLVVAIGSMIGWLAYEFHVKIPMWVIGLTVAIILFSVLSYLHWNKRMQSARNSKATPRDYEFTCFPEFFLSGYVAFTDRYAMQADLNNALLESTSDRQFARIGFGKGFLTEIMNRLDCKDGEGNLPRARFVLPPDDEAICDHVNWLSQLQMSGVDNAPPSTMNLFRQIVSKGEELQRTGPVTLPFSSDYYEIVGENLDQAKLSLSELDTLVQTLKSAECLGRAAAKSAAVELPKGYRDARLKKQTSPAPKA